MLTTENNQTLLPLTGIAGLAVDEGNAEVAVPLPTADDEIAQAFAQLEPNEEDWRSLQAPSCAMPLELTLNQRRLNADLLDRD